MEKYLNDKQIEAVKHIDGPVLVIAGAGSGKTRVLTYRIAYLIEEKNIAPWNILAITFTNKAAREMQERIDELVEFNADEMWIGTFHSVCVRILRRYIDRLGYNRNFVIFDKDEQKTVLKECIKEMELNSDIYNANAVLNTISYAKNHRVSPQKYIADNHSDYIKRKTGEIYELYEKKLKMSNALDFNDLLLKTLELLEKNKDILDYYKQQFKYIMIDEYQDTNRIQYLLIRILGKKDDGSDNVFAVGDEDQAIYSWRGADIRNILDFEKDFTGAKIVKLERNYRSTQVILEAANAVISNNEDRIGKELYTDPAIENKGNYISVYESEDEKDEANYIAERIYNEKNIRMTEYREIAIFVRTKAQTRSIEERLRYEGIPYKIIGGQEFYGRKEIKDILAYLKLIQNHNENFSFRRIINVPRRGIGDKTLEKIEKYALDDGISLFEASTRTSELSFSGKALENLKDFVTLIQKMTELEKELRLSEFVEMLLKKSEYYKSLSRKTVEGKSQLENVNEFISAAVDFEKRNEKNSLEDFLAHISLLTDVDRTEENEKESVTIMTVHAAKGLEYNVAIISGLEDGLFPILADDTDVEEERRLFYVALTRARERVYLTFASRRMIYGKYMPREKSRFIEEIPANLMQCQYIEESKKSSAGKGNIFSGINIYNFYDSREDQPEVSAKKEQPEFRAGDKIIHKTWGEGTVVQVKGEEITAAFENMGVKTMMLPYAPITKK